eukprot:TRINITY_DN8543_c0_g1_i3.p2 TRINITY_DN8543_c0_g1~~TRINITY_DN8543_c0_g1_i3.p2  ORF type:complete len:215 (+),score=64.41 TRINITY_DN8543_c0_g1_i3:599-1243(+)
MRGFTLLGCCESSLEEYIAQVSGVLILERKVILVIILLLGIKYIYFIKFIHNFKMKPFKIQEKRKVLKSNLFTDEETEKGESVQEVTQRACGLAEKGSHHHALLVFDEAISMSPSASLYEQKAQVLLEIGNYFESIKHAEKAVKLDPSFVYGYLTLARAQLNFGELDMAKETLQLGLEVESTHVELNEQMDLLTELLRRRKVIEKKEKLDEEDQ